MTTKPGKQITEVYICPISQDVKAMRQRKLVN